MCLNMQRIKENTRTLKAQQSEAARQFTCVRKAHTDTPLKRHSAPCVLRDACWSRKAASPQRGPAAVVPTVQTPVLTADRGN